MNSFPLRMAELLAAGALLATGCGMGHRELTSLTVSPLTATANGSPVQFTATGHWSEPPLLETPMPANWGACTSGKVMGPTSDVTVSSAGEAACGSGVKGTYTVYAWDPQYGATGAQCDAVTPCGPGCGRVAAQVQLTCP